MGGALTPSQLFTQKACATLAKAMLSSIPLASVVFDLGQAAIEFGNARITGAFIRELVNRIEQLEGDETEKLKRSSIYEVAAHGALRSLLSETNDTVAHILARACVRLPLAGFSRSYEQQCARTLLEATEPFLHALQTNERFHRGQLKPDEVETFRQLIGDQGHQMAALLYAGMPLPDWQTIMERLMQLGLLERRMDMGSFNDNRPHVDTAPTTEFGEVLIRLCFDDMSKPEFGRFSL